MNVDLFFDHYFNFLSTNTKTFKNKFNLINLDRLEALKRQAPGYGVWGSKRKSGNHGKSLFLGL